jgi:hypothetical protein
VKKIRPISVLMVLLSLAALVGKLKLSSYGFYSG